MLENWRTISSYSSFSIHYLTSVFIWQGEQFSAVSKLFFTFYDWRNFSVTRLSHIFFICRTFFLVSHASEKRIIDCRMFILEISAEADVFWTEMSLTDGIEIIYDLGNEFSVSYRWWRNFINIKKLKEKNLESIWIDKRSECIQTKKLTTKIKSLIKIKHIYFHPENVFTIVQVLKLSCQCLYIHNFLNTTWFLFTYFLSKSVYFLGTNFYLEKKRSDY